MYCVCNGPEKGPMVECDKCNGWFHFTCVGLKKNSVLSEKWYCPQCRKSNNNNDELKVIFDGLRDALVDTVKEGVLHLKRNQQQATSDEKNNENNERLIKQLQEMLQHQKIGHEGIVRSLHTQLQVHNECNTTVERLREELQQLQEKLHQQEIENSKLIEQHDRTVESLRAQLQVQYEGNTTVESHREELKLLKQTFNQQELENSKLIKENEELQQKLNFERKRKKLSISQNK